MQNQEEKKWIDRKFEVENDQAALTKKLFDIITQDVDEFLNKVNPQKKSPISSDPSKQERYDYSIFSGVGSNLQFYIRFMEFQKR